MSASPDTTSGQSGPKNVTDIVAQLRDEISHYKAVHKTNLEEIGKRRRRFDWETYAEEHPDRVKKKPDAVGMGSGVHTTNGRNQVQRNKNR